MSSLAQRLARSASGLLASAGPGSGGSALAGWAQRAGGGGGGTTASLPARALSTSTPAARYIPTVQPPVRPPDVTPGPPRPDLVARLLTEASLLSREARAVAARAAAAAPAARGEGDTGSSQVQVAILTHRIASLSAHLQTHRKDHSSRRGLDMLLARRRALLQYLRRSDWAAYGEALARHGLKDRYAPRDRLTVRMAARAGRGGGGGAPGKK